MGEPDWSQVYERQCWNPWPRNSVEKCSTTGSAGDLMRRYMPSPFSDLQRPVNWPSYCPRLANNKLEEPGKERVGEMRSEFCNGSGPFYQITPPSEWVPVELRISCVGCGSIHEQESSKLKPKSLDDSRSRI